MDNTQNNTARKQLAHPKLAMVAMLLGAFVGMLSETSLNIALPKTNVVLTCQYGNYSVVSYRVHACYCLLYTSPSPRDS